MDTIIDKQGAVLSPGEVAAATDTCPGDHSGAIIIFINNNLGSSVHAIIDAPGDAISEAQRLGFLAERPVRHKTPRSVELVAEPPRDDAGKVRRKNLPAQKLVTDQPAD